VYTSSPLLEFVREAGVYLFGAGILGFVVFAVQLYSAKLRRKGVVKSLGYAHIRHPQYLALLVAGFGLLTIWPRIIILLLFVGMGFAYFYLAKFEEARLEARHPEYAGYRATTAMFVPGNPGGRLFRLVFGWIPYPKLAQVACAVVVMGLAVAGAIGLRQHAIFSISSAWIPERNLVAVSVYPKPEASMREAVEAALGLDSVGDILAREGLAGFVAHILPRDYGMLGMFAAVEQNERAGWGHVMGSASDRYKVVFSRLEKPGRVFVPLREAFDLGVKMTPLVIVEVDRATRPLDIVVPPPRSRWGDITMPIF